jgi:hypothetical protein
MVVSLSSRSNPYPVGEERLMREPRVERQAAQFTEEGVVMAWIHPSWRRFAILLAIVGGVAGLDRMVPSAAAQDYDDAGPRYEYSPAAAASYGLLAESLPAELAEDIGGAGYSGLGPMPVSEVRLLMDGLGLAGPLEDRGIRTFGWVEGGYTYASGGSVPLSVQPRQNRFGNEFLVNQIGLMLQKQLKQDEFDIG